jgi:hypothetical protein
MLSCISGKSRNEAVVAGVLNFLPEITNVILSPQAGLETLFRYIYPGENLKDEKK